MSIMKLCSWRQFYFNFENWLASLFEGYDAAFAPHTLWLKGEIKSYRAELKVGHHAEGISLRTNKKKRIIYSVQFLIRRGRFGNHIGIGLLHENPRVRRVRETEKLAARHVETSRPYVTRTIAALETAGAAAVLRGILPWD